VPMYFESDGQEKPKARDVSQAKGSRTTSYLLSLIALICMAYAFYGFFLASERTTERSVGGNTAAEDGSDLVADGSDYYTILRRDQRPRPVKSDALSASTLNAESDDSQSSDPFQQLAFERIKYRQKKRSEQLQDADDTEDVAGISGQIDADTLMDTQVSTDRRAAAEIELQELEEAEKARDYKLSVKKISRLIRDSVSTCAQLCDQYIDLLDSAGQDGYILGGGVEIGHAESSWLDGLDDLRAEFELINEEFQQLPVAPPALKPIFNQLNNLYRAYTNFVVITSRPQRYSYSMEREKFYYQNQCETLYDQLSDALDT